VEVLGALDSVESWLDEDSTGEAAVISGIETARRVRAQDVEESADGTPVLVRGVARERRVSVEDSEMRHGRKSRRHSFDGYKSHVLRDLDSGLVRAVGITAANAAEASVTDAISADLGRQKVRLKELHIDRAYLSSKLVRDRPKELLVYCKAWRVQNKDRFPRRPSSWTGRGS
jgi:hypothetical protein